MTHQKGRAPIGSERTVERGHVLGLDMQRTLVVAREQIHHSIHGVPAEGFGEVFDEGGDQ